LNHTGSTLGIRTPAYLDHLRRFEESKTLISNAATFQRNRIRNFTDCLVRLAWRHRYNYAFKAVLLTSFFYNLNKAVENKKLYYLRHANPRSSDVSKFYYSTFVSLAFVLGAFTLI
jgi:hypothetical protein